MKKINAEVDPARARLRLTRYLVDQVNTGRSASGNIFRAQATCSRILPLLQQNKDAASQAEQQFCEKLPALLPQMRKAEDKATKNLKIVLCAGAITAVLVGLGVFFGVSTFGLGAAPLALALSISMSSFSITLSGVCIAATLSDLFAGRKIRAKYAAAICGDATSVSGAGGATGFIAPTNTPVAPSAASI